MRYYVRASSHLLCNDNILYEQQYYKTNHVIEVHRYKTIVLLLLQNLSSTARRRHGRRHSCQQRYLLLILQFETILPVRT